MISWWPIAFAGEHDAIAPPVVAVAARAVPDGPPIEVSAAPGEPLQDLVSALPRGSTLLLRAGRHQGPLLLDRPLTLVGEPGAVLDGGGTGSVLLVAADDVTVRDLHVTGGGHLPQHDDSGVVVSGDRAVLERIRVAHAYLGIDLRMADEATVRDCVVEGNPDSVFGLRGDGIRLWESDRNLIVGNHLTNVRDLVVWYSDDNVIKGNDVTGSRYGTHLMHADRSRIEGNRYDGDVVGVFVMYSDTIEVRDNLVRGAHGEAGIGLGFKESEALVCEGNVLADNTTGLYVDTTPQRQSGTASFTGNLVAANDFGVRFHGPSTGAVFTENAFVSNRVPAASDERGRGTNASFDRNFWSEYAGYDLDQDGVGDLPHQVRTASGRLRERTPALAWMTGTPALSLVDLFVAAFPMFAPDPVLTDPHPLVHPPLVEASP